MADARVAADRRQSREESLLEGTQADASHRQSRLGGALPFMNGSKLDKAHHRRRARLAALAGLGTTATVVAVLLAALLLRPAPSELGAGAASQTAHFAAAGIALDYPASWTLTRANNPAHYESVIAFIGSGSASQSCPSNYIPGLGACDDVYDLPPNTVELRIATVSGPPPEVDQVADVFSRDPQASKALVAGRTAAVEVTLKGDRTFITWTIPWPGNAALAYRITGVLQGPDFAGDRAAVEAVMRSVVYDPSTR